MEVYDLIMSNRHTDLLDVQTVVVHSEACGTHALEYVHNKSFPMYQPSKSRVVAIIYATMISRDYGLDFMEVLNDPRLLEGDPFFATYDEDKFGYDLIISELGDFDVWKNSDGWVTRTRQYYWLECTQAGNDYAANASDEELAAFFASNLVPR